MGKSLNQLKQAQEIEKLKTSGGGGGSDIPTPTSGDVGSLITYNGEELEWVDPEDLVLPVTYSDSEEDVGKVLTKYGDGSGQYGWVNAQAAYTDYSNSSSGLSAETVQAAIDELASSSGGGKKHYGTLFNATLTYDQTQDAYMCSVPAANQVNLFEEDIYEHDRSDATEWLIQLGYLGKQTDSQVNWIPMSMTVDADILKGLVADLTTYGQNSVQISRRFYVTGRSGKGFIDLWLTFDTTGSTSDTLVAKLTDIVAQGEIKDQNDQYVDDFAVDSRMVFGIRAMTYLSGWTV